MMVAAVLDSKFRLPIAAVPDEAAVAGMRVVR